jgi:hypothetical protein
MRSTFFFFFHFRISKKDCKVNIVIFNMYCNIKSCIVFNKCKSDYFACDNGVRQGENLFRLNSIHEKHRAVPVNHSQILII